MFLKGFYFNERFSRNHRAYLSQIQVNNCSLLELKTILKIGVIIYFRSFLDLIARHMKDSNEPINAIKVKDLGPKELGRFPANEFWSQYQDYSENKMKERIEREVTLALDRERERVESVIKSRIVSTCV